MSSNIIFLLNAARRSGILISVNDGQLQLKLSKGKTIDPKILQDIKDNKETIIDFLNNEKLKSAKTDPSIDPLIPYDRNSITNVRLSFSQERLWFIDQLEGSVQYHVSSVLRLQGELNTGALEYSLQQIVNRHEVLRTVFKEEGGVAWQHINLLGEYDFNQLLDNRPSRFDINQILAWKFKTAA